MLTHQIIFALLPVGTRPSAVSQVPFADVLSRADRLLRATGTNASERRALRQCVSGHVMAYLRNLLPPDPWEVAGTDLWLPGVRVDVVWRAGANLLIDEVKTGAAAGALTSTRNQVERYLQAASAASPRPRPWRPTPRMWPSGHPVAMRVLVTSDPLASWVQPLTGPPVPLGTSDFSVRRCRPPPESTVPRRGPRQDDECQWTEDRTRACEGCRLRRLR
jgi:hypothetical protein